MPREHGFEALRVEGKLPPDLEGTLYRVGPALSSSFGERYRHWFDGDGGIYAVRFAGGHAEGSARVIESTGLREERRRGRRLHGGYGTKTPSVTRQLWDAFVRNHPGKNIANTSVLVWQDRLFALMEGGQPTEIGASDLRMRGETDLGGTVARTFSAHPHYVPERRAFLNFGVRYGRRTVLDIYELPDVGAARRLATIPLTHPTMIHDFVATDRHLVFFAPPLRLDILRFLFGIGSYSENLRWTPSDGTEVIVVPIDDPSRVRRFTTEPFFQFHFGNAFERDGALFVDFVRYADFGVNEWLRDIGRGPPAGAVENALSRAIIDPAARKVRFEERWAALPCEFPVIAPSSTTESRQFTYVAAFGSSRSLPDRLAKVNVERGDAVELSFGPDCFPSEPLFVARDGTNEDDGWLLTLVYDAGVDKSFVAVSDAATMAPPIASVWFDHHIPFTFHGLWAKRS